jgi:hypothetical protein
MSSNFSGKRKAFLVGLNYKGSSNALYGCENDVRTMKQRFENIWKVSSNDIVTKLDGELSPDKGFIDCFNEMIEGSSPGDLFFVHYSGHGFQLKDDNNDEADGYDEALMLNTSYVKDDDISDVLKKLPEKTTVCMIFDCCHSGTMADLPFLYSKGKEYRYANYDKYKCDVVCISGCTDNSTSADAWIDGKGSYGALTAMLLDVFDGADANTTWKQVIDKTVDKVKKAGYKQVPQFSSTRQDLLKSKIIV